MGKIILLIVLIYLGSASLAFAETADKRLCKSASGEFDQVKVSGRVIGVCQIGESTIGSMDLLDMGGPFGSASSLESYNRGLTVCKSGKGKVITAKSLGDKKNLSLCLYKDGSVLDTKTIALGRKSPRNRSLNEIVGL